MSALFPPGVATMEDVIEACALLHPIALQSVSRHSWPPAVARWLESIQAAAIGKQATDSAYKLAFEALVKHPKESTTLPGGRSGGDDGAGYGAAPHDSEAKAEPDRATWQRHVGVLHAAAAVRLTQRPSAP